jgi:hypothetical protein
MSNGTKVQGRPQDPHLKALRLSLPEYSPRTRARLHKATLLMYAMDKSVEEMEAIFARSSRPNGSLNVSDLLERAEGMMSCFIASA